MMKHPKIVYLRMFFQRLGRRASAITGPFAVPIASQAVEIV